MENTITLISGQKIDILMQDEVSLDIDCSLRYIESGKKEIEEYVEDISKKRLDTIVEEAKIEMKKQIDDGVQEATEKASISAKEVIDENISSMKTEIDNYISGEIIPDIKANKDAAAQSAQIASQAASTASEVYNDLNSSLELAQEVACGNIGDIKYTLRTSAPHGAVFCDGQILNREQYPDLYYMILENRLKNVTLEEYQSQVSNTGSCKFFAIDESLNSIKVPTISQDENSANRAYVVCYTGKDTEIDITQEIELNNPFSLLDYKWSEYEITNASWLLSNGQFNSGATYISVYNLLLEIYNGTFTKDGVSVKLSTEEYTDTDFVLNTSNSTFRLPLYTQRILVEKKEPTDSDPTWYNLYSDGWCEQGGKNNTSVTGTNSIVINLLKRMRDTNFGVNITKYDTNSAANLYYGAKVKSVSTEQITVVPDSPAFYWQACGYCNPPSVSEYAEIKGLYFYVGETIQDANVVNASGVLTRVAELSNEYIISLGMPDYSAAITAAEPYTVTNKFTAPADGILIYGYWSVDAANKLYVNDIVVGGFQGSGSGYGLCYPLVIPLSKGDTFYQEKANNTSFPYQNNRFVPLKGVN